MRCRGLATIAQSGRSFVSDLILRAKTDHASRPALWSPGDEYSPPTSTTYGELVTLAEELAEHIGWDVPAGGKALLALSWRQSFVVTQWSCWMRGLVPVSMNLAGMNLSAKTEQLRSIDILKFFMNDCKPAIIVVESNTDWRDSVMRYVRSWPIRTLEIDPQGHLLRMYSEQKMIPLASTSNHPPHAAIVYTSGTTSTPKAVEWTQTMMETHVRNLTTVWKWSPSDRITNVLPLHHIHGLVNVVCCALWSGAQLEMMPRFDADQVWSVLTRAESEGQPTLFMGVPTMYARLLAVRARLEEETNADGMKEMDDAVRRLRLFVSGSAALPVRILQEWEKHFGHRILERYGMTECGMVLSQELKGTRVPGRVGKPLPSMEVKVIDPETGMSANQGVRTGELFVRGPGVFQKYMNRPEDTKRAFDHEGYFQTGDIVRWDQDGDFQILGRLSLDIIKCGGEKISALELEHVILDFPDIVECAVFGAPHEDLGEVPVLAARLRKGSKPVSLSQINAWIDEGGRLPRAHRPRVFRVVHELPRNLLGKLDKKKLARDYQNM